MRTPESPDEPVCFPVTSVVRYRAKAYGRVSGEHAIMKELLKGPVACGIACNDAFTYNYSAGVFVDTTNFTDIDHDVEIVGWGEDADGVKFWHVRNSWGTYWGMNGFFKIVRGVNNLGIESDCHFVEPDMADEALTFTETPLYGGSHWGIVPVAPDAAATHPVVQTTDDVAFSSLPLQPEELPDVSDSSDDVAVATVASLRAVTASHEEPTTPGFTVPVVEAVAFTAFGVAIGFVVARVSSRARYTRIN